MPPIFVILQTQQLTSWTIWVCTPSTKELYGHNHYQTNKRLPPGPNSLTFVAEMKGELGRGGGNVGSMLTFYSDDSSSNPHDDYSFSVKFVFEKNEKTKKRTILATLKMKGEAGASLSSTTAVVGRFFSTPTKKKKKSTKKKNYF